MAGTNPISVAGDVSRGKSHYDGYADVQHVSTTIADMVNDAIRAVTLIDSLHVEGAGIEAEQAANARSQILSAAVALRQEVRAEKEKKDVYDEILERWGADMDDEGYISELRDHSLYNGCPDWLYQLADDIRTAAWNLGYIRAGRYEAEETAPEKNPESVFKDDED